MRRRFLESSPAIFGEEFFVFHGAVTRSVARRDSRILRATAQVGHDLAEVHPGGGKDARRRFVIVDSEVESLSRLGFIHLKGDAAGLG